VLLLAGTRGARKEFTLGLRAFPLVEEGFMLLVARFDFKNSSECIVINAPVSISVTFILCITAAAMPSQSMGICGGPGAFPHAQE
jgi:hypothetical protein